MRANEWADVLAQLTDEELSKLAESAEALESLRQTNPLDFFTPYPKQRDFLKAGIDHRERLFLAGNRTGKSLTGAFEVACHATGNYPAGIEMKHFAHPTTGWVAGASGQSVRDVCQYKLFGIAGDGSDTGMIARDLIVSTSPSHGVSGLYDVVRIRHISGGISTIIFKSYEQSVEKWMGSELDWVWLDEESPPAHYAEALARLTGQGIAWTTFTPLAGLTDLLCRFLREENPEALADRAVVQMSLDEVLHFTEAEKRQRIASYDLHERDARRYGTPSLGSGAVFTTPVEQLSIGDLRVPIHWPKIWGVDLAGSSATSHAFAAVLLAHDRDTDTIYVIETIRLQGQRIIEHAAAIKRIAPDVRVAYPHDGNERERTTSDTFAQVYRRHGLHMLPQHATFPDGGISTEAGISLMDERMAGGRFRVRAHLVDWFDEYRGYHRKDGKLVKVRDDLMSATRIGLMMLRSARPGPISVGGSQAPASPYRMTPNKHYARGMDFDLFAT